MSKNTKIVDIEVYPNYFLFGSYDKDNNSTEYFELINLPDKQVNQIDELIEWLVDKELVGYNVLEYDAQVIEKIIELRENDIDVTCDAIYEISQDVISAGRPSKWEFQLRHKWIDLLQVNHWGVKSAKTASLKWLQFSTNQNILDLPYRFDTSLTASQIDEVRQYCLYSDIPATKKVYDLCQPQINLRIKIGEQENISLINSPEPKIARKLFGKHLAKEMGITEKELRELKTDDVPFKGSDVLLPYIQFQDLLLQKIHQDFKNARLSEDGKFKRSFKWKGLKIELGLGGIHAIRYAKNWESDENNIIYSSDVVSYYPNLAIRNNKYPRHLGQSFSKLYEGYFNQRRMIPKSNPMNYCYKIILNSSYGLTLDKYSFLFDRQLGMFITLNGQLLLLMLAEQLAKLGTLIQLNTDGWEILLPKVNEDKYLFFCKQWEKLTSLELEHDNYSKLISWDINNYIGVTIDGKSKCKGRFEFKPMQVMDVNVLHKNKSQLVVAKAIHDYFVYDIPIEDTIYNHDNIFDFCIGERCQWDSHFEAFSLSSGNIEKEKLPKTIRYYISKRGKVFKKVYDDGREQFCVVHPQKGRSYNQTLFNKIEMKPISEYGIDYTYYLKEARKEIDVFLANQVSLV